MSSLNSACPKTLFALDFGLWIAGFGLSIFCASARMTKNQKSAIHNPKPSVSDLLGHALNNTQGKFFIFTLCAGVCKVQLEESLKAVEDDHHSGAKYRYR